MFNQTPYTINHDKWIAGMLIDGEVNNNISKVNMSAQTLQYGRFVARFGKDGMNPIVAATTAQNILGVVRYELNRAQGLTGDVAGVPPDRDGTVTTMGKIAVLSITNAVAGAPVFVVVGNSTVDTDIGKASNAAGTGAATAVAFPGATYAEDAVAGQLAAISLKVGG